MITATTTEAASLPELRDLYGELHRFGLDLRELSLKFQGMVREGNFSERGQDYAYAQSDPQNPLNRSIDITRNFEFLVAVTGAFSSGKSTLLNLLMGRSDLLPSSAIPLTAVCTVIRYGDEPRFRVRYVSIDQAFARVAMCLGRPLKRAFDRVEHVYEALENPAAFIDGDAERLSLRRFADVLRRYDDIVEMPVSFAEREPLIAGGGLLRDGDKASGWRYFRPTPSEEREYIELGGDPLRWVTREWLAFVRDVTVWIPSPLLENNVVFLDLPGLNCREDYHRRAIQDYCNMADCILVTAFQPGNQADQEVLGNFKALSSNFRDKIFFAFNKVDQFASEPNELVRAVDYLARDTIGADFPRERFFLTSGHLAKAHLAGEGSLASDLDRLRTSLTTVAEDLPGLAGWVESLTASSDPGGVTNLQTRLCEFLVEEAYPSKIQEIVKNYHGVLEGLLGAASPTFEESLHMDAADILRKSVLDFFRYTERLQRNAIYRFRFDYLRSSGQESSLQRDLKQLLEQAHGEICERIENYFDQPILSSPLREDPVSEFDLQKIADEASEKLRRELQELVTVIVHSRVRSVFREYFKQCEFDAHAENLFSGAPDCLRRLEAILKRFEETMLHSLKCIVRNRFFYMPRGRELKRLERKVRLSELKELLVEIFSDFYPSWIYENIYGDVIDQLWLSLFLDCEDLEQQLAEFFTSAEGVITGAQVAERVDVPHDIVQGSRDLYRTVRMCQEIDALIDRRTVLESSASRMGATV